MGQLCHTRQGETRGMLTLRHACKEGLSSAGAIPRVRWHGEKI